MKRNLIMLLLLIIACSAFSDAVLGVILKEANSSDIDQSKRNESGVYIEKVLKNGKAKEAGMKIEDIIIEMDGEKVYTLSQLRAMLKLRKAGDAAKFVVLRDGKKKSFKLKLGSREEINPTPGYMGIYEDKLSERRREKIGLKVPYGVQVDVVREGPAHKAGMKTGDVILELAGHKAYTFDQLKKIIKDFKAGEEIDLKLFRDDEKNIKVTLGSRASDDEIIRVGDISVSIPDLEVDSRFKREFIPFYSGNILTNEQYIGATIRVVSLAKNEEQPETFVEIQGIIGDTPADESDLKVGDRIIKVDGKVVEDYHDITKIIESADKDLEFEFSRKSKKKTTKIKPVVYKDASEIRISTGSFSHRFNFSNHNDLKKYLPKGEKIQRTMADDEGNVKIATDKNLYKISIDMVGKII